MIRRIIETFDDGSFQHDCSGKEALVMPVVNRTGDTIDTLAWIEDQPFAWWRHRLIGQVLGDKALQVAEWTGAPIHLYETPAGWLAAGDPHGVCILDWTGDPRRLLNAAPRVIFESERLRNRVLERAWDLSKPHFDMEVGIDVRRAA